MKKKSQKKSVELGRGDQKCLGKTINLSGSLWKIFDISLFSRDVNQVLNILESRLDLGIKRYWVATVNPEFVMEAKKDRDFRHILKNTSLNVMDGIGLVWARELEKRIKKRRSLGVRLAMASKIGVEILQGKHRDQVASGADLMLNLGEMVMKKKLKIFFLGGFDNRAERTANFFRKKFFLNKKQIDWCEGKPKVGNDEVINKINRFKPDVLLVAYGMKKQEFWINNNLKQLEVGIVMGIGRAFDYYSGELKRAPEFFRKIGLEWLYSLIKEPKRIKRQVVLPKFIWQILRK